MLVVLILFLIILGMVGGYALSFIDPNGIVTALLGGILVVLIYIANQMTPKKIEMTSIDELSITISWSVCLIQED